MFPKSVITVISHECSCGSYENWLNICDIMKHWVHYSNVITGLTMVSKSIIQAKINKNIKAPRHWHLLWGNSPVTGEFLKQRANNAKNVSIWWRRHGNEDQH